MAEILLVAWILGLIVIAIAWGGMDLLIATIKTTLKDIIPCFRTAKRRRQLEIVIPTILALAVVALAATNQQHHTITEWARLPKLLLWAGTLWLIPFEFHAIGHNWFLFLSLGVILALLLLLWSTSYPSLRRHAPTDFPLQPERGTSIRVTGRRFIIWILLVGLTVAALARYTSTWKTTVPDS